MIIDGVTHDLLLAHVALEQYAYALYLSIGNFADHEGYTGMAKWADAAAAEELEHAKMFLDYARQRGLTQQLAVEAPPSVNDFRHALDLALDVENRVWNSLAHICTIAIDEQDDATAQLCGDWILKEQVPAVKQVQDYAKQALGTNELYILDQMMFK